jgi:hypothetical protein
MSLLNSRLSKICFGRKSTYLEVDDASFFVIFQWFLGNKKKIELETLLYVVSFILIELISDYSKQTE